MRKRQNGTGSVYRPKKRRSDGTLVELRRWWIKYYNAGRPVREPAKTTDRKDAERLLRVRLAEIAKGTFAGLGPERVRIRDLTADLVQDYRDERRSSLPQLLSRLENHVLPAFGDIRAAEVGTQHVKRYVKKRQSEGASTATTNRELEIVRRAFRLAAECDPPKVARVPRIKLSPENNIRTGFLEHEGYEHLRDVCDGHVRLLLVLGYHTGIRSGVLRKIRREWINLRDAQIRIPPYVTKNRKSRIVPIYGEMGPAIEMALAELDANWPACPFLVQRHGKPITEFKRPWATACRAAGLEGLKFHDLRRSAVRNMRRAGISEKVAMEIIGHKTRSMLDRYNIVDERDLTDAADKMERFMSQQQSRLEGAQAERVSRRERVH